MKALLLAEKHSLMKTIQSVYSKMNYPDKIDFDFFAGHVVGLKEPREYKIELWQSKKWSFEMLPMMPDTFEYKVLADKKKKFNEIKEKLKNGNYDYVINACDPEREGNHIFHLFYTQVGCKLPIKRFWTNDLSDKSVENALKNLRTYNDSLLPNMKYLTDASVLRGWFDWLIGMNLTIAESLTIGQTTKVGRVKSPTLCILGKREEELANFKSKTTYGLNTLYKEGFSGTLFNNDGEVILENKKDFDETISKLGKTAIVESIESKVEKTYAPKLFNLSALQHDAGVAFGYDADETLNLAQSLYEKKVLSYPRTDCPYVGKELAKDFDLLLQSVSTLDELKPYVSQITNENKKRASTSSEYVNDKELAKAGHYALVPTATKPNWSSLTKDEVNILTLVYKRFLAIFMPPTISNKTVVVTTNNNYKFKTNGKVLVDAGYAVLYDTNFKDVSLPKLNKGDLVNVDKFEVKEKVTKPPKRYTDAELVIVMEKPGNFLEDENLKEVLKDKKGIGTEATRAGIIQELEKNGYIEKRKGKAKAKTIFVTELGMFVYQNIKNRDFAKVDMTGIWETKLSEVENGKVSFNDFNREMREYVLGMIEEIKNGEKPQSSFSQTSVILGTCPKCKSRQVKSFKNFYACEGYKEQCDFIFAKEMYGAKISESEAKKIVSGKQSKEFSMKNETKSWNASLVFNPESGRVEFAKRQIEIGNCPYCGGQIKNGKDYFLCENYPNSCKVIVPKNYYGAKITNDDITKIINGERTRVMKMQKGESSWETALMYLEDKKQVGFAPREAPKEIGKCPCCGGKVVETQKGYICENYKKSCMLYIAKEMYGAKIPSLEVKKILLGQETKEFSMSNETRSWDARLVYNPETKRVEFAKKKN